MVKEGSSEGASQERQVSVPRETGPDGRAKFTGVRRSPRIRSWVLGLQAASGRTGDSGSLISPYKAAQTIACYFVEERESYFLKRNDLRMKHSFYATTRKDRCPLCLQKGL